MTDLTLREEAEAKAEALAELWAKAVELSRADVADSLLPIALQMVVLQHALDQAIHQADTDPLTGLCTRRKVLEALNVELARTARQKSVTTVVLIDLDHFKRVNDQHGHLAGDAVLAAAADAIRSKLRQTDTAGRYGGEELMLVLSGQVDAKVLAERIRAAVFDLSHRFGFPISASFGIAASRAAVAPDFLVAKADLALYRAKALGRNRVEVES